MQQNNSQNYQIILSYPITMYDVNNKEKVAIFKNCCIASKYLFGKVGKITSKTIISKRIYKSTLKSPYEYDITFRVTKKEDELLLEDNDYIILNKNFEIKNAKTTSRINTLKADISKKDISWRNSNDKRDEVIIEISKQIKKGYSVYEIADNNHVSTTFIKKQTDLLTLPSQLTKYTSEELDIIIELIKSRQQNILKQKL